MGDVADLDSLGNRWYHPIDASRWVSSAAGGNLDARSVGTLESSSVSKVDGRRTTDHADDTDVNTQEEPRITRITQMGLICGIRVIRGSETRAHWTSTRKKKVLV